MRAMKGTIVSELERLSSIETDECVLWPYSKNQNGYGQMSINGKTCRTHRLSCIKAHGMPPTDKHVAAHSCRNRDCLNPRHLRWATPSENSFDRHKDGTDKILQRHGRATLQTEQVVAIRNERLDGDTYEEIADRYGVSKMTVYKIVTRRTWKWC